jgi:hypothetical protein
MVVTISDERISIANCDSPREGELSRRDAFLTKQPNEIPFFGKDLDPVIATVRDIQEPIRVSQTMRKVELPIFISFHTKGVTKFAFRGEDEDAIVIVI